MLTDADREILKPFLGNHYSAEVLKILQEYGVTNNKGKSFSNSYITMVFKGQRDNLDIELALFELRDRIKRKQRDLKSKRKAAKEE